MIFFIRIRIYNNYVLLVDLYHLPRECVIFYIFFFTPNRRETAQVHGVLQGVQPVVQPDHAPAQALRLQAFPMRPVRQGVSAEGRPAQTQGEPASRVTGPTVSHH